MILKLKSFSQLIEDMAAALQSSTTALMDISVGSVIRAIFEANASIVLWLQWMIIQVLQTTRASTSLGSDLDTWMRRFWFDAPSCRPFNRHCHLLKICCKSACCHTGRDAVENDKWVSQLLCQRRSAKPDLASLNVELRRSSRNFHGGCACGCNREW